MVGYRVIGWMAAAFVLACLARTGAGAGAPKPTSKPATAPATAKVWKLPALTKVGCFAVADALYAVIQDTSPGAAKSDWHLLDLKTGTVTNLAEVLKGIRDDFKSDLTSVEFSPNTGNLLAQAGAAEPWWFDLAGKQGRSLASTTGTQCFWLGDRIIQYAPGAVAAANPANPTPGVATPGAIPAKAIDPAHFDKIYKCTMPGTVLRVNEKGNAMVCWTTMHVGFRDYRLAFGAFGVPGGRGVPVAVSVSPAPQFALSPGGKYLLATTYDDPSGAGIVELSAKTSVFSLSGKATFKLAQVGTPVYVSEGGRAITRTPKGVLLIWDVKGKESQELLKDAAAAGVWHGNLYYVTNTDDKWQLNMTPLPPDPKAKP